MKLVNLFKRLFYRRSKVADVSSTVKLSPLRDCVCLKYCTLVLYPEYMSRPLEEILSDHFEIEEYAYILHNKNPGVRPHYHIYLSFSGTGVSVLDIADWFRVPYFHVESYYEKSERSKCSSIS